LLAEGLILVALLSRKLWPCYIEWNAVVEVAIIYAGIFITMTPVLKLLQYYSDSLPFNEPIEFFILSGILSSFLDNSPTYLTCTSLAIGVIEKRYNVVLDANNLSTLLAFDEGRKLLAAISCGSVIFGAITPIGNAPNLIIIAMVEETLNMKMPDFLTYTITAIIIFLPSLTFIAVVFFLSPYDWY